MNKCAFGLHDWFVPRERARECRRCRKYQTWFSYDASWTDEPHPDMVKVWTVGGPEWKWRDEA